MMLRNLLVPRVLKFNTSRFFAHKLVEKLENEKQELFLDTEYCILVVFKRRIKEIKIK